ncbi:Abi-alpha family protein [Nocardioides sp. BP30]|uniref:Abi-alpha family protein n=1 Tax=Nocardioides sp. BP30 TaxID=3036374 RepID=UPI002469A1DD|nr:Abi-alpha family protein [Nocardioides sp. BP30]WGL52279.1 Abi-alpha family protein [Nocardioides sp. BP30]
MSEYDDVPEEGLPAVRRGAAVEALPGIARLAATSWLRTAQWGMVAGVRTGRRVAGAVAKPHLAVDIAAGVAAASGVVADLAKGIGSGMTVGEAVAQVGQALSHPVHREVPRSREEKALAARRSLREQGEALLARSRDVWDDDGAHPAYARILGELAPDEARILVLLVEGGPQPSVDVRSGMVSSSLIAAQLNMIGARAGLKHVDQVPAYLNNLFRLGLIWFSREQLKDPLEYQVVEAQPDVLAALHATRATRVVRRSIQLTPFGVGFCRACLVDDPDADFPEHSAPLAADTSEPPKG